jgi:hypothetical protein
MQEDDDSTRPGECAPCRSSWKPTRRELVATVLTTAAITMAASTPVNAASLAPNSKSLVIQVLSPSECAENHAACYDAVYDAAALCGNDANTAHDICDDLCIGNHTGIGQIVCRAGCNASLAAHMAECVAIMAAGLAACDATYYICIETAIAAEMLTIVAGATQWVIDNSAAIGTTFVYAGIIFLVIACVAATSGWCLVTLA